MIYLDAVLADNGHVLYNSTPENVVKWLQDMRESSVLTGARVMKGRNLAAYSPEEYLANENE